MKHLYLVLLLIGLAPALAGRPATTNLDLQFRR